jgi:hypothetical protein
MIAKLAALSMKDGFDDFKPTAKFIGFVAKTGKLLLFSI